MTAPDHATNHSKKTLRERGNTWVLDSANLLHMAGLLIPPIVPPSRSDFSFAPTTPTLWVRSEGAQMSISVSKWDWRHVLRILRSQLGLDLGLSPN